jgi:hypothetical protein
MQLLPVSIVRYPPTYTMFVVPGMVVQLKSHVTQNVCYPFGIPFVLAIFRS